MSGGDAADDAYDTLTDPRRRDAVLASPEAQALLKQGMPEDQVVHEVATAAARKASAVPAALGGAFGATGLERVLAGGKSKGRLATGLLEGLQGATEETATGVSAGLAARQVDPSVDPTKGAGVNFAAGAIYESVPGFALGGQHEPVSPEEKGALPAEDVDGQPAEEFVETVSTPQALPAPPAQPAEWSVVDERPQLPGGVPARPALGLSPEQPQDPTVIVDSRGNAMRAPEAFVREAQARRKESEDLGLTPDVRAAQAAHSAAADGIPPDDSGPGGGAALRLPMAEPTAGEAMLVDQSGGARRSTFMEDQAAAQRAQEQAAMGLTPDVQRAQAARTISQIEPTDVQSRFGTPFMLRLSAQARADETGGTVIEVSDGYVVRRGVDAGSGRDGVGVLPAMGASDPANQPEAAGRRSTAASPDAGRTDALSGALGQRSAVSGDRRDADAGVQADAGRVHQVVAAPASRRARRDVTAVPDDFDPATRDATAGRMPASSSAIIFRRSRGDMPIWRHSSQTAAPSREVAWTCRAKRAIASLKNGATVKRRSGSMSPPRKDGFDGAMHRCTCASGRRHTMGAGTDPTRVTESSLWRMVSRRRGWTRRRRTGSAGPSARSVSPDERSRSCSTRVIDSVSKLDRPSRACHQSLRPPPSLTGG